MTGTLYEDRYALLIICRSVLLTMINVSDKSHRENQNTHFMFHDLPPPPSENLAFYEIMWKNLIVPGRPQMTWRMCIACCIPKATNIQLEYVIFTDFSAATTVAGKRLIAYLRCPFCHVLQRCI